MTATDKAKVAAAALIAALGLYSSLLGMAASPVPLRWGVFLVTVASACALMYFTEPGRRFLAYVLASVTEMNKVVWPQRDEVLKMSGVVLVFVTLVAIFLWLVDSLLGWLLQFLAL